MGGDRKPRRSMQLRGKIFDVTRDSRFSATRRRSSTSRFFFAGVEKAQGHRGETESQWTKRSSAPHTIGYPSSETTLRVPFVCLCHTLPCRHIDRSAPTNRATPYQRPAMPASLCTRHSDVAASFRGSFCLDAFHGPTFLSHPLTTRIKWKNRHAITFKFVALFSSASPFCRFRADVARVCASSLRKLAKVSFFVLTEGPLKLLYISISNLNFLEFPSDLVDFSVSTDFRREMTAFQQRIRN